MHSNNHAYIIFRVTAIVLLCMALSFVTFFNSKGAYAQGLKITKTNEKDLYIEIYVQKGKSGLVGAAVVVKENGSEVFKKVSTGGGKTSFNLKLNSQFLIEVSKAGHITQSIMLSTKMPPEAASELWDWRTEVNLFEELEGLNMAPFQAPVKKIFYDEYDFVEDVRYEKDRIKEMEAAIEEALIKLEEKELAKEEKELAYQDAIKVGDKAFGKEDYQEAITSYEEALAIKPQEKYPKDKIAEARKKMEQLASAQQNQKQYETLIAQADDSFKSEQYEKAKATYNKALGLIPSEQYPKDKIKEIDKLLADAASAAKKEKEYQDAIKRGDQAMTGKSYETAKKAYNDALAIKPKEKYPQDKLSEIEKLLGDLAEKEALDKKYNDAIKNADASFAIKDYSKAKSKYQEASEIKPGEKYPKDRIAEIENLLAAAEKEKIDQAYKEAISRGDKAFGSKSYDAAKKAYNEALGVKPKEQYPKDKIAEIDQLLGDLAAKEKAQKEKEENYKAAIAKADAAFSSKDYGKAKSSYLEASGIKPGESYPKDRITEINKLLAAAAEKEKQDQAYKDAITRADKAFGSNSYDAAKKAYNDALGIKPGEKYPKDKIAEIDKLLGDIAARKQAEKEREENYKAAIAKADAAFSSKYYGKSKSSYQEALGIKPGESYPKGRIAEIDKILAAAAENEKQEQAYKDAISRADKALGSKSYDAARKAYNDALGIKPGEKYPKDKIAEIDKLLGDIAAKKQAEKERDEKYNSAISRADAAFSAKDYSKSKSAYQEASGIKPTESYPKQKIADIDKLLASMAADRERNEKYKTLLITADIAFKSKDYDKSKSKYKEALALKPDEQHPKDKIAEIDKILADIAASEKANKEREAKYKNAIARADASLSAKDYTKAKSGYNEALSIKSNEQYPKDKLAEIDKLIAEEAEAQRKAELIKKAKQQQQTQASINTTSTPNKKVEEMDKKKKEVYLSELAKKYPEGITVENIKEANRKIKRIIVRRGNEAHEYKEITYNWGGVFYFKDDESISKNLFDLETKE